MQEPREAFGDQSSPIGYTLSMFAEEVRIILAPAGIESRLEETHHGDRSITAWPADDPEKRAEFSLD
jgi:hypothetical protein